MEVGRYAGANLLLPHVSVTAFASDSDSKHSKPAPRKQGYRRCQPPSISTRIFWQNSWISPLQPPRENWWHMIFAQVRKQMRKRQKGGLRTAGGTGTPSNGRRWWTCSIFVVLLYLGKENAHVKVEYLANSSTFSETITMDLKLLRRRWEFFFTSLY